jgi:hypothetical protein
LETQPAGIIIYLGLAEFGLGLGKDRGRASVFFINTPWDNAPNK